MTCHGDASAFMRQNQLAIYLMHKKKAILQARKKATEVAFFHTADRNYIFG